MLGRRVIILDKILSRVRIRPWRDHRGRWWCCWEWQGPCSGSGRGGKYPRMALDGQTVAVHRVIYTLFYGYIPGKKQIDHNCENRRCVNPFHLEMVTHKQNQKRRDASAAERKKAA